jgi:hypothetical protein
MKTTTSAYKKALLRKYHTVCRDLGVTESEKIAIKESFGVNSSRNLSEIQLTQLIDRLVKGQDLSKTQKTKEDLWRKRTMAAVGAWLRMMNKTEGADTVKAIICRASGYTNFNKIPISKLRSVYYEFVQKSKTISTTRQVKNDLVEYLKFTN